MYLSMDGTLTDFYEGEEDLKAKKLVFVGKGEKRMEEDLLRILRYFRFHAMVSSE